MTSSENFFVFFYQEAFSVVEWEFLHSFLIKMFLLTSSRIFFVYLNSKVFSFCFILKSIKWPPRWMTPSHLHCLKVLNVIKIPNFLNDTSSSYAVGKYCFQVRYSMSSVQWEQIFQLKRRNLPSNTWNTILFLFLDYSGSYNFTIFGYAYTHVPMVRT